MVNLNIKNIPKVEFLGGSSTLIFGPETLAGSFLDATIYEFALRHQLGWLYPEAVRYRNLFDIDDEGNVSRSDSEELFLEIPREIFYQTMGKKICLGGEFVFVKGVNAELVEKFDHQNSDGYKEKLDKYIEQMISQDEDRMIEIEEYDDEYPPFDEFGNVNQISWLRDYAMYAESFSKRNNLDVFLSLEWNKPESHLPSPFLGLFDRIYKFEENRQETIKIVQVR